MNSAQDAPQSRTTITNAPATAILADDRRKECVKKIFEEKYEHYCILAFKYVGCMDDAKDIVAHVFEGALRTWPPSIFDAILNLEAYIYTAVKHCAINKAKRNQRLISIHDLPIDTFLITNPMEKFDLDIATLAAQLPFKQREALTLFLQGYNHKEITQKLNLLTEGASKNLIYYAKKNLKKLLSELPEFDPDDNGSSNPQRKEAKRVNVQHKTALKTGSGSTPKIKDLLNYLNGYELIESNKRTILQWLIYQEYAFDIISGLNLALRSNNAKSIEAGLRKDKNNLREQLFGSSNKIEVQSKPESAPSMLPNTLKNWNLPIGFFNYEIDNREFPLINAKHFFNTNWLKIQREILLNYSKNNSLNKAKEIVEKRKKK